MVIDASALMAYFLDETGADVVEHALDTGPCWLSAVQRSEVIGKLVGSGAFTESRVSEELSLLGDALTIAAFDLRQSDVTGFFYARRAPYRLSLGDCACLALAETRGLPVLTAERAWASLPDLRVQVQLIR